MKKAVLAALVLVLLSPSTWAQVTLPSFSGTWSLDVAKSDFGPAPPPESVVTVIEHSEPNVKITTTQKSQLGELTNERAITTDGKENKNKVRTMAGEQDVISTSTWNESKLMTAYKLDVQGMTLDINESWELSEAGKILTMVREIKTGQGDFTQKMVFNRQ